MDNGIEVGYGVAYVAFAVFYVTGNATIWFIADGYTLAKWFGVVATLSLVVGVVACSIGGA